MMGLSVYPKNKVFGVRNSHQVKRTYEYELKVKFRNFTQSYLSLREWCLHVFQQTGQVLFTVTHHKKQTKGETQKTSLSLGNKQAVLSSGQCCTFQICDHARVRYGQTDVNFLYTMLCADNSFTSREPPAHGPYQVGSKRTREQYNKKNYPSMVSTAVCLHVSKEVLGGKVTKTNWVHINYSYSRSYLMD